MAGPAPVEHELKELSDAVAMLDRYDAPTDDEGGYDGKPLSIANRIEALVYRNDIQADIVIRDLRKALEPFARMGELVERYDLFRGKVSETEWADAFREARRAYLFGASS